MPRQRNKTNLAEARARMYHDLVFECAERVFAEEGFAESSMQDLAAEAGISLKTLYATFAGKDDIYKAILSERGAGLLRAISAAGASEGSAMERVAIGVRGIVTYLVEHERFFRILLQEGQAWGLNPRGGDARENWQAGLLTVHEVLVSGMESGELLPGDPDLLAPTVNAILQVQLAGLLDRGEPAEVDAICEQIVGTLRRLLCGGEVASRAA